MDSLGNFSGNSVPPFKLIDHQLRQVKILINQQLIAPAKAESIKPLLEHINTRSGKMIRPGLVLLAGACCGQITNEHIKVAAIVEMIHNATLLHDDVIDDGQKRRGLPTINSLWGNETAVLLGDFLLSRVLKLCTGLNQGIANLIAATTARTCEGELRQVIQRKNWILDESEYIDIITEKSAAFFSGCCQIGAVLSKADKSQVDSLACFGLNAGIAFQIVDDLLDITGDEIRTGKTAGSDVKNNKLTLATIHLLRTVDESQRQKIYKMLESTQLRDSVRDMLRTSGSLEYACMRAKDYVDKAIKALNNLAYSDAKEALIETAKFLASRAT